MGNAKQWGEWDEEQWEAEMGFLGSDVAEEEYEPEWEEEDD